MIDEIHLEPLYCEPLYDNGSQYWKLSFKERICLIIPIVGWVILPIFHFGRMYPVIEIIENQLIERADKKLSHFYENKCEKEIADKLSASIMENMGWCNDRYIPCDPLKILLWSYAYYLDITFVFDDIEDMIGRELTDQEVNDISEGEWVVDDLVGLIVDSKRHIKWHAPN